MTEAREPWVLEFPADAAHVRTLRHTAREAATELGAAESTADALVLVLDELVNNSIEHGAAYRNGRRDLKVSLSGADGDLLLEFEDPETPEPFIRELQEALGVRGDDPPPLDNERGRGLFLIRCCLHEIEVSEGKGGGLLVRGRIKGS